MLENRCIIRYLLPSLSSPNSGVCLGLLHPERITRKNLHMLNCSKQPRNYLNLLCPPLSPALEKKQRRAGSALLYLLREGLIYLTLDT